MLAYKLKHVQNILVVFKLYCNKLLLHCIKVHIYYSHLYMSLLSVSDQSKDNSTDKRWLEINYYTMCVFEEGFTYIGSKYTYLIKSLFTHIIFLIIEGLKTTNALKIFA